MREILFRGKDIDNGAWVEGAFCMKDCDTPFGDLVDRPTIIKYEEPNSGYWFRVDPETVGQFTGLTDKNGKKIFEGDIIEWFAPETSSEPEIAYIEYDELVCVWIVNWKNSEEGTLGWIGCKYVSVIGNIHDNPDLLKGGVENEKPL